MSPSKPLPNNHPGEIILFTFPESVFGRRVQRYLNLRKLNYSQIRVPPNMPRPIQQDKLGVNYRRIPILSIGRDIYIDTRLILSKLENFFPEGRLGARDGFNAGFETMLEEFVIDAGPFWRTAGITPTDAPLMQRPEWVKDRFEGSGGQFSPESLDENRAWSLTQLRFWFSIVEQFLADGRDWILGTDKPSLSDIHAGWNCDWALFTIALKEDVARALSKDEFPRVHAWVERFRLATEKAAAENPGAGALNEGEEAEDDIVKRILASDFTDPQNPTVDENDPLGLKKGQKVSVAPVDFGFTHKDQGILVGLSRDEVVIEVNVPGGHGQLRLHYPRINFKILPL